MTRLSTLPLLFSLALLAACNKSATNDRRSASGEVLQGTISDEMLPLDKLKSEPPLLAPSKAGTTPEGVEDEQTGADDVSSEVSDEATEAAPAPSPSGAP